MLSDIGHLLSDIDYLFFVCYTRLISSLSASLYFKSMYFRNLIPLSTSTYSVTFLNTSPTLSFLTSIYYGIYSFIHALISPSLFLFSIYFQSYNLFTFSFSSFINLFVSSFVPLHSRCCTHSRQLNCPVLTHIGFSHRLNLWAPCVLYIGQAFRYSPENAFHIVNQYISLSHICLTVHH